MKVSVGEIVLTLDEATLQYQIEANGKTWRWSDDYCPCMQTEKGIQRLARTILVSVSILLVTPCGLGGIISHVGAE